MKLGHLVLFLIIINFAFSQNEKNIIFQQTKKYYKNGKLKFVHDGYQNKDEFIMHGKFIKWDINGVKILEGKCEHGKLEGTVTGWYSHEKQKFTKNYKNGALHGKSIFWKKNGEKTIKIYKSGKLVKKFSIKVLLAENIPFGLKTKIMINLYILNSGKYEHVCSHVLMRSPNIFGATSKSIKRFVKVQLITPNMVRLQELAPITKLKHHYLLSIIEHGIFENPYIRLQERNNELPVEVIKIVEKAMASKPKDSQMLKFQFFHR